MTVCTDEVALDDLGQDTALAVCPAHQIADVARLGVRPSVIPGHRSVVELPATVRARASLERPVPVDELRVVPLLLAEPPSTRATVVRRVVLTSACPAHRLMTVSAPVKILHRLGLSADATALAHVVNLDGRSDVPDHGRERWSADDDDDEASRAVDALDPNELDVARSRTAPRRGRSGRPSRAEGARRSTSSGKVSTTCSRVDDADVQVGNQRDRPPTLPLAAVERDRPGVRAGRGTGRHSAVHPVELGGREVVVLHDLDPGRPEGGGQVGSDDRRATHPGRRAPRTPPSLPPRSARRSRRSPRRARRRAPPRPPGHATRARR